MALIWRKTLDDTDYEVRSAGRTRRLYTNGVFHSQYNPARPWTHGVWDLLMLPCLFYAPGKIRRVLILGVGGGAVIHLLQTHLQADHITGIDLNPVHLDVARRFFGVKKNAVQLLQADAVDWLAAWQGPAFDLIIDDLFGDKAGEPVRAVELTGRWCALLKRKLSPHGMIIFNTMGRRELHDSAFIRQPRSAASFRSAWQLSLPLYENAVGAFLRIDASRHTLYKALDGLPRTPGRPLDFRIRKLPLAPPDKLRGNR